MRTRVLIFALLAAGCASADLGTLGNGVDTPEVVDFGDVPLGLPRTIAVAIVNQTSSVLEIRRVVASPDFTSAEYAFRLSGVPQSIAAGATAMIDVSFEPLVEMTEAAASSFTITTQGGDNVVGVRARGVEAIRIEPAMIDFGGVPVGETITREVELVNLTDATLEVDVMLDDAMGAFLLSTGHASIAAGGSTKIGASVTSRGAAESGRMMIDYCGGAHPLCERSVRLTATSVGGPLLCDAPYADFQVVARGDVAALGSRCTAQSESVTIELIELDPPLGIFAARTRVSLPRTLARGESIDLVFNAMPDSGDQDGTYQSNAVLRGGGVELAHVELSVVVQSTELEVSPAALDFGTVVIGTSKMLRLLVTNAGMFGTQVSSHLSSGGADYFSSNFIGGLGPGESHIEEIEFSPTRTGAIFGELVIEGGREIRVPLTGIGVDLGPCSAAMPSRIDFGPVAIGRTVERRFTIDNVGTSPCLLTGPFIYPGSDEAFMILDPRDLQLAPGESDSFTFRFLPSREAYVTAGFGFYISDPLDTQPEIGLSGTGTLDALIIEPRAIDFGQVELGCTTRTADVRLTNGGDVPITFDAVEVIQSGSTFHLTNAPGPMITLGPREVHVLTIDYAPLGSGAESAELRIWETGNLNPYVVPISGESIAGAIEEEHFVQRATGKTDFLFVVDSSPSVQMEQQHLADAFTALLTSPEMSSADYRMAVINMDLDPVPLGACPDTPDRPMGLDQGQCGYFANGDVQMESDAWRVISSDDMPSPEAVFERLVTFDEVGSGLEQGLEAAYRALSPAKLSGWNSGLLRSDADFVLVFLTDEEDSSPGTIDLYFDAFSSVRPGFKVLAIVGDVPGGCPSGDPGARYIDIAARTGGSFESVCVSDFARITDQLTPLFLSRRSTFRLAQDADAQTIEVFVDGVQVPPSSPGGLTNWTYDPPSRSIAFSPFAVPVPGAELVVRYAGICP